MSETNHYKGKLTPTGKDLFAYVDGMDIPHYYHGDKVEFFEEELESQAVIINGEVYEIERNEYEDGDDIFESSKNKDGSIDFQVKYYNGGCGFQEALSYALKDNG